MAHFPPNHAPFSPKSDSLIRLAPPGRFAPGFWAQRSASFGSVGGWESLLSSEMSALLVASRIQTRPCIIHCRHTHVMPAQHSPARTWGCCTHSCQPGSHDTCIMKVGAERRPGRQGRIVIVIIMSELSQLQRTGGPLKLRTSQPGTSFMISFSRDRAACWRRYRSRSPSAINRGTRCIRDQSFSRSSSLWKSRVVWQAEAIICPISTSFPFHPP
jgi:hypothetical protein